MGNRPISYQDLAVQIFYASIFYPFANFRQLANTVTLIHALHSKENLCYQYFYGILAGKSARQVPVL